jgi:hypothetical protein
MEDAKTIYAASYAMMHPFFEMGRLASANYPMSEVDVEARVYVSLNEERHFERVAMTIDEYIAELRAAATEAPAGTEPVIEYETDAGYDDDYYTVRKIGYWRDPTPEERAEREAHNQKAREHNAALQERKTSEERAEFERLKAKYESS